MLKKTRMRDILMLTTALRAKGGCIMQHPLFMVTRSDLENLRMRIAQDEALKMRYETIAAQKEACLNEEFLSEICKKYAAEFSLSSGNLLFNGGTGLGKTFLSACIARAVADRGYSVAYETASHLFSKLEKANSLGVATVSWEQMQELMAERLKI